MISFRSSCDPFRGRKHPVLVSAMVTLLMAFNLNAEEDSNEETVPANTFFVHDAVRMMLQSNVDVLISEQSVVAGEAQLQQVSSVFDPQFSVSLDSSETRVNAALSSTPDDLFVSTDQETNYSLSVTQQLRSGISVTPNVSYAASNSNTSGLDPSNYGSWQMSITVPLMKGLGELATAGEEMAAKENVDALQAAYEHTLSQQLSLVISAYWQYLSATRNLEIFRQSESWSEDLVEQTEALIQANRLPASEINKSQADLASSRATRVRAEFTLISAQRELGLLMGISGEDIAALPPPSTDFVPVTGIAEAEIQPQSSRLLQLALDNRRDLQSAEGEVRAAEVLRKQAEALDKIDLDLNLSAGYAGYVGGTSWSNHFDSYYRNIEGPSFTASVSMDWGWRRNLERGVVLERRAGERQARLREEQLEHTIYTAVLQALQDVRTARSSLLDTDQASALYQTALQLEEEKLKLGQSTLLDYINLEEIMTRTNLQLVQNQLQYASAVINLRFQTGTLLILQEGGFQLDASALTTLP